MARRPLNPWVRFIMDHWTSDDARWHALRESGTPAYQIAGAANSGVACYQLSEDEFRALYPRPRLRDYMVGLSETWRHYYRMETAA